MMRQAGRYMAVYRKLAEKYPSFRVRSETVDLIVEISLQPWRAFRPDGVIIFSDILTPLPAFGVPFEIEDVKGPIIQSPICDEEGLKCLHPIDLEKLQFVGESLMILRGEVDISFVTPKTFNKLKFNIISTDLCVTIWNYNYNLHQKLHKNNHGVC